MIATFPSCQSLSKNVQVFDTLLLGMTRLTRSSRNCFASTDIVNSAMEPIVIGHNSILCIGDHAVVANAPSTRCCQRSDSLSSAAFNAALFHAASGSQGQRLPLEVNPSERSTFPCVLKTCHC